MITFEICALDIDAGSNIVEASLLAMREVHWRPSQKLRTMIFCAASPMRVLLGTPFLKMLRRMWRLRRCGEISSCALVLRNLL